MNTHTTAVLRGAYRRFAGRPWLTDLALGGGLTAFDVATLSTRQPAPSAAGLLLWGLGTFPLLWRRRCPRAVLAAMTAVFVVFEALDPVPGKTPGPYLLIFAVYAVARCRSLPVSLAATALSLIAAVATDLVTGRSGPPQPGSLEPITATTFVAFYGVAWLLGYGRRRIGIQAGRLRELNDRLRAEQETNARQAIVAERARIARDLHDVVAHHVSAIALQARATEEALQDEAVRDGAVRGGDVVLAGGVVTDGGANGVARIADTADTALIEMRRILGLLTGPEEDLTPEPSLQHLGRLIDAAEAAGCQVTATLDDSLGELPLALRISGYRIAQEALTNVRKHAGPTEVLIAVRHGRTELTIEVENGPPAPGHRPVPGSGRGLIGVRERVAAFDGTLHTGPLPGGGWRVLATLPLAADPRAVPRKVPS
ncbi:sensor histidine kinase [Streptomyces sp. NPDC101150]|uniref:sensor histidine kinase n=1 Tax=Streptomyces sp. NPDC101150 TaxID=3366114 RepID=UPI00380F8887